MKKRLLLTLLLIVAVCATCFVFTGCENDLSSAGNNVTNGANLNNSTTDNSTTEEDGSKGLNYRLSADGTYYIVIGIGNCTDADIVVPSKHNGKPVKKLSHGAFALAGVDSITISEGITTIGDRAFYYCGASSIKLSNTVKTIGNEVFWGCNKLKNVVIGSGLTKMKKETFIGCDKLEKITLPFVGASATASNGYDQVFGYIFGYNATPYGIDHKDATYQGKYYNSETGNMEYFYYYIPTTLKTVIITGGANISNNAFYNCSSLISISIPNSVTSIGSGAFYNWRSLTHLVIGNSVTSIGESAFDYCLGLSVVYYMGSVDDWSNISIGSSNSYLKNATRYYYVKNETDVPTDGGNYWHYVDGVPTVWAVVEP